MYTIKGKTYADAGYILRRRGVIAWQGDQHDDYTERPLNIENISVDGDIVKIDGIATRLPSQLTYAALKTHFVHLRYTNDDQMAIILNKDDSDDDALAYRKMQDWREWSGRLAHAIIGIIQ